MHLDQEFQNLYNCSNRTRSLFLFITSPLGFFTWLLWTMVHSNHVKKWNYFLIRMKSNNKSVMHNDNFNYIMSAKCVQDFINVVLLALGRITLHSFGSLLKSCFAIYFLSCHQKSTFIWNIVYGQQFWRSLLSYSQTLAEL